MIEVEKPKIVSFAGGTGRFSVLQSLKHSAKEITAVCNNVDSGGSSGRLRVAYGCLPFGDMAQAIAALAKTPKDEQFWLDRFPRNGVNGKKGGLEEHRVGNIMCLSAVSKFGVIGGMDYLVEKYCVEGSHVYPISAETDIHLAVAASNNYDKCTIYFGEHTFDRIFKRFPIIDAWLTKTPKGIIKTTLSEYKKIQQETKVEVQPLPEIIEAIKSANILLLGPGTVYGSQIPHYLIKGIPEAIADSRAIKILICNFVTDPTETSGFQASNFAEVTTKFLSTKGKKFKLDYFIVNNGFIIEEAEGEKSIDVNDLDINIKNAYASEKKHIVPIDEERCYQFTNNLIVAPVVAIVESGGKKILRHHSKKTEEIILKIYQNRFSCA